MGTTLTLFTGGCRVSRQCSLEAGKASSSCFIDREPRLVGSCRGSAVPVLAGDGVQVVASIPGRVAVDGSQPATRVVAGSAERFQQRQRQYSVRAQVMTSRGIRSRLIPAPARCRASPSGTPITAMVVTSQCAGTWNSSLVHHWLREYWLLPRL